MDLTVQTPRCCIDRHVEILAVVAPLLDAAGVRWWIDYGMLLGHAVSGGFYWNDRDIDIGVLAEDREKVREIGRQLTRTHRFQSIYRPANHKKPWTYSDCVKIVNSWVNKATLDITFWYERGETLDREIWASVDRYKGREMPRDWIFPVVRGQWEGVNVALPREALKLVEYRYGENWRNLPATRTSGVIRGVIDETPKNQRPVAPARNFGRPRADCEVTDPEGEVLRKRAAAVPADQAIVEIGAYKGRSMCWLALGSSEGNSAQVYSVDLWEEGPGYALTRQGRRIPRPYAEGATRRAYETARRAHGHGLVTPLKGNSPTIAEAFTEPVGMLFVDGDHTEAGVTADLLAWMPKLAPGGIIAFHDMNAPGVLNAIKRFLGDWQQVERERLVAVFTRKETTEMKFLEAQNTETKLGAAPAENKSATDGLDDVSFASPAAKSAALAAGLSPADFKRVSASSEKGFTKADVESLTSNG